MFPIHNRLKRDSSEQSVVGQNFGHDRGDGLGLLQVQADLFGRVPRYVRGGVVASLIGRNYAVKAG